MAAFRVSRRANTQESPENCPKRDAIGTIPDFVALLFALFDESGDILDSI
ncbi:MAG: hypothetical protein H8E66_10190 [Planctomycetes bacterium]|nr:hypothetical protein [Planctomycetota bacterium]